MDFLEIYLGQIVSYNNTKCIVNGKVSMNGVEDVFVMDEMGEHHKTVPSCIFIYKEQST